ncbi:MAG TPA: hypothetical protein VJV04_06570 [Nitrospiraceae bacterium]|nr:hypothetical protein [Nitrospiraceae bacterium]
MPSFFHLMVGLGGTALVVGVMALWLYEPQPPSSLSSGSMSSPRPRMVGNSALSHGGPSPDSRMSSPARFQLGQKLIVAAADNISRITLLPIPADPATSSSPVGETRHVLPGTVVFVSGMQAIEPVPSQTEQYYEVTIPDGGKGWLPERVLRPATSGE